MFLNFLHRIKRTLKQKSLNAITGGAPSEGPETGIVADIEISIIPDAVSTGGELPVLLKIIRENAEVLKIMYGDSLPVKNIIAVVNQAIVRTEKQKTDRRGCACRGSP